MKPVLLLIDFQNDFLSAKELEPAAGQVVEAAAGSLELCRRRAVPVIHVWTTVRRDPDDRMPHWKTSGQWRCEIGTPGHQPPDALRPLSGEPVVHKQFFSGFAGGRLDSLLKSLRCDALIMAGVHLHGCVRATAMDAYERGYAVHIAADAVASDDPIHSAITRRYLSRRAVRFVSSGDLLNLLGAISDRPHSLKTITHYSPAESSRMLWQTPIDGPDVTRSAAMAAQQALSSWWRRRDPRERARALRQWAETISAESESLAADVTRDVGKPITMSRGEIRRGVEILRVVADMADQPLEFATSPSARYRHEPLGVVAIITPYNNPVAIPLGKVGPALLFGNAVVWKPAPAATMISRKLLDLAQVAGLPEGVLTLCAGDHSTAELLADDPRVDGLTISGSSRAGYALQEQCARRHIPFQAELGGNNAAIVWEDAAIEKTASLIAEGAFGFAGQRCTANRRAIVASTCFDAFVEAIERATAALAWGDPLNEKIVVGPLIGAAKCDEVRALLDRARSAGQKILAPHPEQADYSQLIERGAFHPPTIVIADDPACEIVQEETFGPVLVVQRANDFDEAIGLCNGVRQGLIAAVFSESREIQAKFLSEARAGVLKINRATADADAVSPLGGWKASGVGPAEHGPSDREFYCRVQTIYQG